MTTTRLRGPHAGPWGPIPAAAFLALLSGLVGIGLPFVITAPTAMTLMTQGTINAILATSVGYLIRQSGFVSFGQASFFGLGAYVTALLIKSAALPFAVAVLLGVLLPTLFGFLISLVIVRVSGVAFSMLTLAVAQVFYEIVVKWRDLAGGDDGLSVTLPATFIGIPSSVFQTPTTMFAICWITLTLILFLMYCLSRSRFGMLCSAIRDNEERARFIGYGTLLPRAVIFAISSASGAIGGVLFCLYNGFVSPDILHWTMSGAALVMAIVGGAEFVVGPALGALVYLGVKDALGNITEHWQAIVGIALIIVTVGWPTGIAGLFNTLWKRVRAARPA